MDTTSDYSAAACWSRFVVAAEAARAGHYSAGHALIERIRARSGDYAAETARRELRRYAGLEDPAFEAANARLRPVAEILDAALEPELA